MINRAMFCPECRNGDVKYAIEEKAETVELKGEEYEIKTRAAFCECCGAEIWVPEIDDANLKVLYDAYRQKHGIISLEDIRAIPEKYNIGKRPLSILLGWGEQTFSRYYDGDMPIKRYSEILKRIYTDATYYSELFEQGKERLKI